jgi:nitroimidazol reductase NimA-like FMN-containing flavoprotein (pyridoxamine 5'-phosphate oxidase superfamily)
MSTDIKVRGKTIKMDQKQIRDFIEEWTWGSLIAIDGNRPYAIELAYASDGKHIYCASRPSGKMARCIKKNQNIMFKISDIEKNYTEYRVASVFGKAEQLTKKEDLSYMIRLVNSSRSMNLTEAQMESFINKLAAKPNAGGPIRLAIRNLSGRAHLNS